MPARLPWTISGASTAERSGQDGSEETSRGTMCRRLSRVAASSRERRSPGRTCSRPSPSMASTARVSASAIAAAPVSARRCGVAPSAVRGAEAAAQERAASHWRRAAPPAWRPPGCRVERGARVDLHTATARAERPIPRRTPIARVMKIVAKLTKCPRTGFRLLEPGAAGAQSWADHSFAGSREGAAK